MRWSPTHTDWAFAMIEGNSPNGRHDPWPSNRGRRDSSVGRGKSVTIPIQLNTGSVFKINCEKILAKEVIEIMAAVVSGPLKTAPRSRPLWVIAKATYTAFGRPEEEPYRQCFANACPNLPSSVEGGPAGIFQSPP